MKTGFPSRLAYFDAAFAARSRATGSATAGAAAVAAAFPRPSAATDNGTPPLP